MKAATKLALQSFKNFSGSTSWRFSGLFRGERIRKNFQSRADALAEKDSLEFKLLRDESGMRSIATSLSNEQSGRRRLSLHGLLENLNRSLNRNQNERSPQKRIENFLEKLSRVQANAQGGGGSSNNAKPADTVTLKMNVAIPKRKAAGKIAEAAKP